jgi:HPt (histidine-containing phosphotransfer) domain-containing protein
MGGLEATQHIRSNSKHANLPIIALTAGVTQEERESCLASGMDDFIAKPINPETLIETLARLVKLKGRNAKATHINEAVGLPEVAPNRFDNLPGFDVTNAMRLVGGDQSLLIELLSDFREDMADVPARILAKANVGDLATARELAHSIKGAAGNLGAVDLYTIAAKLEGEFKRGDFDKTTFAAFDDQFNKTMTVIEGLK